MLFCGSFTDSILNVQFYCAYHVQSAEFLVFGRSAARWAFSGCTRAAPQHTPAFCAGPLQLLDKIVDKMQGNPQGDGALGVLP